MNANTDLIQGTLDNSRRAKHYTVTLGGKRQLEAATADWTRRAAAVARILKSEG